MKNEEIIERLAKAAADTEGHGRIVMENDYLRARYVNITRAVLKKLAECGMSEEMKQAVRDHSSVSTDRAAVAFRAALRSLGGE